MVKKLLKHEMIYYSRTLLLVYPSIIIASLLLSVMLAFMNDNIFYILGLVAVIGIYIIALSASGIITTLLGVVRFYKNMYSEEGYLTHTLPVNNSVHIFTKLLGIFIFNSIYILFVIISIFFIFIFIPDFWVEINQILFELNKYISSSVYLLYIIEFIVLLALSSFISPLIYYSCISIGQLSKKYKILISIGIYYAYNIALQIIGSILMMIFSLIGINGGFGKIKEFVTNYPNLSVQLGILTVFVFELLVGFLLYKLNLNIMNNKLNLE